MAIIDFYNRLETLMNKVIDCGAEVITKESQNSTSLAVSISDSSNSYAYLQPEEPFKQYYLNMFKLDDAGKLPRIVFVYSDAFVVSNETELTSVFMIDVSHNDELSGAKFERYNNPLVTPELIEAILSDAEEEVDKTLKDTEKFNEGCKELFLK